MLVLDAGGIARFMNPGWDVFDSSMSLTLRASRSGPALRLSKFIPDEFVEPTVRYSRTPDFESGTFDHSATSPEVGRE